MYQVTGIRASEREKQTLAFHMTVVEVSTNEQASLTARVLVCT